MANSTSPLILQPVRQFDRPLQDEWGIFDPQQAGLEALLRRLSSPSGDKDGALEPTPSATK